MGTKISELPAATALTGAELVPVVQGGLTKRSTTQAILTWAQTALSFLQAGTGAVTGTVQTELRSRVRVEQFGAVGDGTTDNTTAFSNAITALIAAGGGDLLIGPGTFLLNGAAGADGILNGVYVAFQSLNSLSPRVIIKGAGPATILKAGTANMVLVRISDSHSGMESITLSAGAVTGVRGLAIVPGDTTQTNALVYMTYNTFRNLHFSGAFASAIWARPGPTIAANTSDNTHNEFYGTYIYGAVCGIFFDNGATNSNAQGRYAFFGGIISGLGASNTGIQIDNGQGHRFYSFSIQAMANGVSPNATPTAVKIAATSNGGVFTNDQNEFNGCSLELNTRDLDNGAPTTRIIGGFWNLFAKFGGTTVHPGLILPDNGEVSFMPLVLPGLEYGGGVPGFASGYWGLSVPVSVLWLGADVPTTITGDYVVPALTTGGASIIANKAGTITLTLPAATYTGRILMVRTIQAQTVVSNGSNVVPLAGGAAGTAILSATAGKWATLQADGTNWQIMAGN